MPQPGNSCEELGRVFFSLPSAVSRLIGLLHDWHQGDLISPGRPKSFTLTLEVEFGERRFHSSAVKVDV